MHQTVRRTPRVVALVLTAAALAAACSSGGSPSGTPGGSASTSGTGRTPATAPSGPIELRGTSDATVARADRCEFFSEECLTPFPSDHFTRADASTPTGRRVSLAKESMPATTTGIHIDPAEWNLQDGFSPGALIVLKADGIDPDASKAPPVTDLARSLDTDSPTVLLDADTGERIPHWVELDAQAHLDEAKAGPDRRALLIRPAVLLPEGHRIVVALRDLKRADGTSVEPDEVFLAYRDRLETKDRAIEDRRRAMEDVFALLGQAGIARDDLYLSWDFTVASTESLTGRILKMRDETFADLGDRAPTFTVEKVTSDGLPDGVLRIVEGTVDVPNYLTQGGAPGSVLNNAGDPLGLPTRDGTYAANFLCVVPKSAEQAPARVVLYGHGLLGSVAETKGVGQVVAGFTNAVVCGTDWIGMSTRDVGAVAQMLGDLSGFRIIPDRLQQAMLDFLVLGRVAIHPDGFGTNEAFRTASGSSVLGRELSYAGSSQGGIIGGALSAVAQDWTNVFLGVPGMNYSTLLNRSVDFDRYAVLLRNSYPDPLTQQLGFSLIQMLWDRGENQGFAAHLTDDTLPQTPAKKVLLLGAYGDHQVANVTLDVLARTTGAELRAPGLGQGRSPDREPFWDIPTIGGYPFEGRAAYVMWDFGTPAPPTGNVPNRAGKDPHGMGRAEPAVLTMVTTWLFEARLPDPCPAGEPCQGTGGEG